MKPTKIKARKMWQYTAAGQGTFLNNHPYGNIANEKPVFVLDASRYGEVVEQMAKDIHRDYTTGEPWKHSDETLRNQYRVIAKAALRSIGITKSK